MLIHAFVWYSMLHGYMNVVKLDLFAHVWRVGVQKLLLWNMLSCMLLSISALMSSSGC